MAAGTSALAVFAPNRILSKKTIKLLIAVQVVVFFLVWAASPFVFLPSIKETLTSWSELWAAGLGGELITSLYANAEALALATLLSLLLAYSTRVPFFRPIVAFYGKLRFLSMVGLTFFFTLMTRSTHELKISLLVFSVSVFFVTGMADVIAGIPQEQYDLARTLRMGEWRVIWEVV